MKSLIQHQHPFRHLSLFHSFALLASVAALFTLTSCQQDYNVELPPYESKLVVECYLEAGKPPVLILSESSPYFSAPSFPLVSKAKVILSYEGRTDTLVNRPFPNPATGQVYNYGSLRPLPRNPQGDFRLTVTDSIGRKLEATTRFQSVVPIKSLQPIYNAEEKAYCLTKFADDPTAQNYYRLVLNKGKATTPGLLTATLDDNFSNGNEIIYGSGYSFVKGDTVIATLYHLDATYYKFLTSSNNANAANFNPFAVSGEIVTNVRGGLGIMAALSYDRKTVIVPAP